MRAVEKVGRALDRPEIVRKEKPLQQTEAFRRGRRRLGYMRETGRHGDEFMYDLAVDTGFAGRPHVVSEAELQQHISDGDMEMWRGQTDASYADAFLTGPAFYGQGFRGNAMYAAGGGDRAHALAVAYAQAPPTRGVLVTKVDKPVVMHMALRRDAKVINHDEASMRAKQEHKKWWGLKGGGEGFAPESAQTMAEANNSPTRWALANGYDAMLIPKDDGTHEIAVLNRTALLVSHEFEPAGQNVTKRLREGEGDEDADADD